MPAETISTEFIASICERLAQGKQVRAALPLDGRLHIDRQLPFLCVYRRPLKNQDTGTERLAMGEAAHLIASGDPHLKPALAALVQQVAFTLSRQFGAFLIIEIWAAPDDPRPENLPPKPGFRVIISKLRPPTTAIEALERGLKTIKILKRTAAVEIVASKKRAPGALPMLLSSNEARKINGFVVGLEVQPIYRNPATGEIYPIVLRDLHRGLAAALKQAFFEFSETQTSHRPPSYQALGRRAFVKSVWSVDRQLAEIDNQFDFLLQITPINTNPAWAEFKRKRFERMPTLYYRPLPADPALLKRKLYQIPMERVEDPTLSLLFRQKRLELDRQLTMLSDRGSRKFLYGSLQLFGGVSASLKRLAEQILATISPGSREGRGSKLNAATFAKRAQAEIDYYREMYPALTSTVKIRDDTVGLMVSRGHLLVGREVDISTSRVEALLQHEIGTHVLTYFNGRAQPFQQLYLGLAGYEELQEGLAVLAEYLVGGLSRPRLRLLAGRVIAAHCLIEGASFVDTYRELTRAYGFKRYVAFTITVRIYRGGGLTKDAVYLRGLVGVLKYLKQGGQLEPLFVGKIAADHIPIIQELQARQVLRAVPLRPRYLDNPQTTKKLERLQNGMSVLDLIERKKK